MAEPIDWSKPLQLDGEKGWSMTVKYMLLGADEFHVFPGHREPNRYDRRAATRFWDNGLRFVCAPDRQTQSNHYYKEDGSPINGARCRLINRHGCHQPVRVIPPTIWVPALTIEDNPLWGIF